ncbi:hypothetical protein BS50DRAFT_246145 [Corynespora cassiicola Philippines]|uniref:Uncharacterized protein n=1 Tax=Corynespora cassiicola Philippines TaxID=1448308 RepID=A0A2T2P3C6_CORCC|nr:hypothetical protein BS50DRAFT_246145 [Corynespora cassiicola Philippines]
MEPRYTFDNMSRMHQEPIKRTPPHTSKSPQHAGPPFRGTLYHHPTHQPPSHYQHEHEHHSKGRQFKATYVFPLQKTPHLPHFIPVISHLSSVYPTNPYNYSNAIPKKCKKETTKWLNHFEQMFVSYRKPNLFSLPLLPKKPQPSTPPKVTKPGGRR